MLKIVMIMLCGIGAGYLLRNRKMSFIGRVITALIWVLLFLLGIEVGANPRIVNGLQTLGLEAIVLTIAGSLGSAVQLYVAAPDGGLVKPAMELKAFAKTRELKPSQTVIMQIVM